MTGRKVVKQVPRRRNTGKQAGTVQQSSIQPSQTSYGQQQLQQQAPADEPPAANIKKEQPPPPQVVKKILKADNDEARTLKTVFKSNPDSQMKDFIRKAVKPGAAPRLPAKTPADSHPVSVAQELIETDDDVADNLARLFKVSKSYKNL